MDINDHLSTRKADEREEQKKIEDERKNKEDAKLSKSLTGAQVLGSLLGLSSKKPKNYHTPSRIGYGIYPDHNIHEGVKSHLEEYVLGGLVERATVTLQVVDDKTCDITGYRVNSCKKSVIEGMIAN